jgi:uncharacterized protein YqeY
MSIADSLTEDLKRALKAGDKNTVSVIRMIKSAIQNKEIEKGESFSEEDILSVLQSLIRQSRESLEQFSLGKRMDLAEKEAHDISVIQSYLPRQLSREEIENIIKETVHETGAKDPGDMGKVMKALMPKVKGQADGKVVSNLVKKALAGEL